MRLLCWRVGFPILVGTLLAASASASPIFVNNFSFETLPAGGLTPCGAGCAYSIAGIPGWTNSGDSGQFQTTTAFNSIPNGITVGYSNGGTITQTVGQTVQAGQTYTLMVDVGHRNDFPGLGSISLLVNGVTYAGSGSPATPGNWSTFTATYTALAADIGKSITIVLSTPDIQGDFDNVRLSDSTTTAPVPEPATSALIGLGAMALGLFARRKKV